MNVTIYSTNTCQYCKMLTRWLDDHKIEYTEHKVDSDREKAQEMIGLSGQMGVPFTTIETDGGMFKVLGFDVQQLRTIFSVY